MKARVLKHEDGSITVDLAHDYNPYPNAEEVTNISVVTDQDHRTWVERAEDAIEEIVEHQQDLVGVEDEIHSYANSMVSMYNYELLLWALEVPLEYQWCLDEAVWEGVVRDSFWEMLQRAQYHYSWTLLSEALKDKLPELEARFQ